MLIVDQLIIAYMCACVCVGGAGVGIVLRDFLVVFPGYQAYGTANDITMLDRWTMSDSIMCASSEDAQKKEAYHNKKVYSFLHVEDEK